VTRDKLSEDLKNKINSSSDDYVTTCNASNIGKVNSKGEICVQYYDETVVLLDGSSGRVRSSVYLFVKP
jgi:UDP-N-acetyl-D-mannosaminuronic acid transferase (WecB/TagA/CpsF family)